jgi:Flp pilus assembly protein TadG
MAAMKIVCFIFMFAIFEYGRYVFVRQMMENAARSGARVAVITPTSYLSTTAANSAVDTVVQNAMAGVPAQNVIWSAYQSDTSGNSIGLWTDTPFGNNLVVKVEADFTLMFPTFNFINTGASPNTLHLTTWSMMRSEAN